jgi:arylsulfatase A-like enzyme
MAAKIFSRLMAEFDGNLEYCHEAMEEVLDAADQLATLENLQHENARR